MIIQGDCIHSGRQEENWVLRKAVSGKINSGDKIKLITEILKLLNNRVRKVLSENQEGYLAALSSLSPIKIAKNQRAIIKAL